MLVCCAWCASTLAVAVAGDEESNTGTAVDAAQHFDNAIAPLLARRCLDCHNATDLKGGLDLSTAAATQKGGDSGAVIAAGSPDESPLWNRIEADEMPPKHPLSADERKLVYEWIKGGAAWGSPTIDRFRHTTEARAGYDWWSLAPLAPPQTPEIDNDQWSRNPVDRFILAGLAARGLSPGGEADRRTLIRRVTFDLTGLPPTPDEIAVFENDAGEGAYERVVDRLLAAPQYGVRWARHWLDVVRFGESNGFEYDELRPSAWPYRDWVVHALNDDLPYDEFARLQLAGDVLHPHDLDASLATGFLAAGAYDTAGQSQQSAAMRAVVRQD
ncbi:MAG: DUF1549 domain-containing protein, partial [Singulisphaera sp.]